MYCHNRLPHRCEKLARKLPIFHRRKNSRGKIDDIDSHFLDWSRKLPRRAARVFDDPCRSANQIFNARSTKICFEDPVGVIEITDD